MCTERGGYFTCDTPPSTGIKITLQIKFNKTVNPCDSSIGNVTFLYLDTVDANWQVHARRDLVLQLTPLGWAGSPASIVFYQVKGLVVAETAWIVPVVNPTVNANLQSTVYEVDLDGTAGTVCGQTFPITSDSANISTAVTTAPTSLQLTIAYTRLLDCSTGSLALSVTADLLQDEYALRQQLATRAATAGAEEPAIAFEYDSNIIYAKVSWTSSTPGLGNAVVQNIQTATAAGEFSLGVGLNALAPAVAECGKYASLLKGSVQSGNIICKLFLFFL